MPRLLHLPSALLVALVATSLGGAASVLADTTHKHNLQDDAALLPTTDDALAAFNAAGIVAQLQEDIDNKLQDLDPLRLPFIPYILYAAGVSLSLTKVTLKGFSNIKISLQYDKKKKGKLGITATIPSVSFVSDQYIAGGRLLNLPVTGESVLTVTVQNLTASVNYEHSHPWNLCVMPNTTRFAINIGSFTVNFEDLNPDSDTGILINDMLSGFGDDIVKWLTLLLNTDLYPKADNFVTTVIDYIATYMTDIPCPRTKDTEVDDTTSYMLDVLQLPQFNRNFSGMCPFKETIMETFDNDWRKFATLELINEKIEESFFLKLNNKK